MIIIMASRKREDIDNVVKKVEEMGYQAHLIEGVERTVVAAVGDEREKYRLQALESLPHVEQVLPILKSFKLAGREIKPENTVIEIGNTSIGGDIFCVMAGPCAVESREQILETAKAVKAAGAHILRGGAYKPRTSPYSFQGMEEGGLKLLKEASEATDMPFVTEVMTPEQLDLVCDYADVLQIGARNMQNYGLLKAVGKKDTPVFLKRGMMSTINEWLMSAEYIMSEGNNKIIMCERGIRTFETETRNTLDLSAVPVLKKLTHLPVVIDPSHGTGHWDYVSSMSLAAAAAGADGLQVEVHPNPAEAFSDGPQSLKPKVFDTLMENLKPILATTGKKL
ncbi:MAG: 3-deoxy-7-phosphoheptulonate synthase [Candidatus Hydrogenedentota bacterium]